MAAISLYSMLLGEGSFVVILEHESRKMGQELDVGVGGLKAVGQLVQMVWQV